MEIYTDPEIIIHHICTLLMDEEPRNWRIGVGLIKTLGNPYELGVEYLVVYHCTPIITLQVMDYMVKHYGVLKDSWWTYPEINNTELVLYKRRSKPLAA